jgi:hypothetical protein
MTPIGTGSKSLKAAALFFAGLAAEALPGEGQEVVLRSQKAEGGKQMAYGRRRKAGW